MISYSCVNWLMPVIWMNAFANAIVRNVSVVIVVEVVLGSVPFVSCFVVSKVSRVWLSCPKSLTDLDIAIFSAHVLTS